MQIDRFCKARRLPTTDGQSIAPGGSRGASTTVMLRLGASPAVVRPRERCMPVNVAKLVDDNVLMGFEQGRPYLALCDVV
jgi:hypothetical protein